MDSPPGRVGVEGGDERRGEDTNKEWSEKTFKEKEVGRKIYNRQF